MAEKNQLHRMCYIIYEFVTNHEINNYIVSDALVKFYLIG